MSCSMDLSGARSGKLLVLELVSSEDKIGSTFSELDIVWRCLCDCGNYTLINHIDLSDKKAKSCGCQGKLNTNRYSPEYSGVGSKFDITGKKFNRLTAISWHHNKEKRGAQWTFTCDCGTTKVIQASAVVRGRIKSCGCIVRGPTTDNKRSVVIAEQYCSLRAILDLTFSGDAHSLLSNITKQMQANELIDTVTRTESIG